MPKRDRTFAIPSNWELVPRGLLSPFKRKSGRNYEQPRNALKADDPRIASQSCRAQHQQQLTRGTMIREP